MHSFTKTHSFSLQQGEILFVEHKPPPLQAPSDGTGVHPLCSLDPTLPSSSLTTLPSPSSNFAPSTTYWTTSRRCSPPPSSAATKSSLINQIDRFIVELVACTFDPRYIGGRVIAGEDARVSRTTLVTLFFSHSAGLGAFDGGLQSNITLSSLDLSRNLVGDAGATVSPLWAESMAQKATGEEPLSSEDPSNLHTFS
ncbi:hypothetical protein Fmac_021314 [Flemingia macrophylla]|uniref:Uncharacterized protein n=1 Tax=Flemingia macrophylla TaxID=520843 RepID=A0ABD1LWR5_9FABA